MAASDLAYQRRFRSCFAKRPPERRFGVLCPADRKRIRRACTAVNSRSSGVVEKKIDSLQIRRVTELSRFLALKLAGGAGFLNFGKEK